MAQLVKYWLQVRHHEIQFLAKAGFVFLPLCQDHLGLLGMRHWRQGLECFESTFVPPVCLQGAVLGTVGTLFSLYQKIKTFISFIY